MSATTRVMPDHSFVFRARALRVIDGDTIDMRLDRGMHDYSVLRLRLADVNCPELHGATRDAGLAARAYTLNWVIEAQGIDDLIHDDPASFPLLVQTYKSDDFGRYIALVWRIYDNHCLQDDLLASGNAVEYMLSPVTP